MLEKPNLPDEKLIACARDDYGLRVTEIVFLPLGADPNTAVYRVADGAAAYFLKLRSGGFDEATVAVPRLLKEQGVAQIIAPVETRTGQLSSRVDDFAVILSPFVMGQNGFEANLSDSQWRELGVALRGIHAAGVPEPLRRRIPHEAYSPRFRDAVGSYLAQVENTAFDDPVAAKLATIMRARRGEIAHLVARAEALGDALRERSPGHVLCHADIHGGNVLIGAGGALHIVDWDTLMFAPKERDLMFIGGGVGGVWHGAREGELFHEGYGAADVDPVAIAYYRHERIVEDIAVYCDDLLATDAGGADREENLRHFASQFQPNSVVEIARRSDVPLR